MKRFILLSLIFSVAVVSFSSCKKDKTEGGGQIISETRNASGFYNVSAFGSSSVIINYGTDFSITVKGYENLVPRLETKVQNGTLFIQYEKGSNISNDNIEVTITMPSLISVSVNGNNEMKVAGNFVGMEYFTALLFGSGNISIDGGTANNFKVIQSGSGNLHAFGFSVDHANVNQNGSGNIEINVSKTLSATIAGSGNLYYKGNPQITSNISGSGNIIKQ